MTITIEYPGFFHLDHISSGDRISLPASVQTVADLLGWLQLPSRFHRFILPVVNGTDTRLDHRLADGDHVFLYIPVGGG